MLTPTSAVTTTITIAMVAELHSTIPMRMALLTADYFTGTTCSEIMDRQGILMVGLRTSLRNCSTYCYSRGCLKSLF